MSASHPQSRIPNPQDPISYVFGLEFHGHKLGLENIRALIAALGHPERTFQAVHVAGTNGKGSVAVMCATALSAAGYRTGCYTSPHLVSIEERFRVDGEQVSRAELERAVEEVRQHAVRLTSDGTLRALPTFFEVATASAFLIFRQRQVQVAVLEVGLGGRLDATNVVSPQVGVITTIDLDHQRHLGSSIADIAREKAGIIKPGMTIICGERKAQALAVIAEVCLDRGATLVRAFEGIQLWATGAGRAVLSLTTPACTYPPVALALRGQHQVENAVVAVRALEALDTSGTPVPADAVIRGLAAARWPGRLELVDVGGGRSVLLDGAHNPAGARTLGAYLGELHPDGVVLVFGAVADKDHRRMLRELLPHARSVVLTMPPTHRAAPLDRLCALVHELRPGVPVREAPSPDEAIALAQTLGPMICVAGSIYLLGAILPLLPRQRPE